MKEKYLVTGAGGFIGSWVVKELVSRGFYTIAVIKPGSKAERLRDVSTKIKLVEANLIDPSATKKLLKRVKPDYILHLATFGVYSYEQKDEDKIILGNYKMLASLLDAAKSIRLKKFVNTGSVFEYGTTYGKVKEDQVDIANVLNKYSATKMATTALASAYVGEIPILTLRPFTNYGPMEDSSRFIFTVIKKSLQGEEIRVAPNINRDFVYVKDVARAYLLASRVGHSDGEVINIGSGVRHTLTEVAREIVKLTKSKSEIIEDEVFLRPKDSRCWADITRANKLLRWKPKYTRINGLKETISWLKKDLH